MSHFFFKKTLSILSVLVLFVSAFGMPVHIANAQEVATETYQVTVHVFERDDCTYCKAEQEFLDEFSEEQSDLDFVVVHHDIVNDEEANLLYQQITTLKRVPRITPITIIGNTLIQGFDAPETTGVRIEYAIEQAQKNDPVTLEAFIQNTSVVEGSADAGCESGDVCLPGSVVNEYTFKLPIFGVVDLRTFSLTTLSVVLGIVDGFNPCAMWVLVTFLLILMQIGNRTRMLQIAGLFILAEAIMYALILNVWYTTWDFVGLDALITPLVGLLALGGGAFFLYRYYKARQALVCDVTDFETQSKIQAKITKIAQAPLTLAAIGGIIAIAFSINVIEFACSVGIPQAFTKILELNQLSFAETQWFTFLYILFYMVDDLIVFGLAFWGFDKIHATAHYARWSLLIGGILMLILGTLLTFAPQILVL